jgi:hypothetical protein
MRMSNYYKYIKKDKKATKLWHDKSLRAYHKHVSMLRPQFFYMQNVADLYYSFGETESALNLYRDITHLIETDSIVFYEDNRNRVKQLLDARKVVERETTLINLDIKRAQQLPEAKGQ